MQNLSKKFYLEQNFFIYAFWFFQAALLSLARVVCLEIMFPQFSLSRKFKTWKNFLHFTISSLCVYFKVTHMKLNKDR